MSIIPFDYDGQQVRVIDRDGDPWFVAKDACDILGTRTDTLRAILDEDEVSEVNPNTIGVLGGRSPLVISEAGLYSLTLRSRKSEAKPFKRWVTHEVLPSIRKRGGYLTPEAAEAALTDPDFIIRLATDLKTERAKSAALALETEAQQSRLRLVEPKAAAFDRWLSSNVDYSVAHVANALATAGAATGRNRLFDYMADIGWIYRVPPRGDWHPKQTQIETRRLAVKLGTQLNTRTGEDFATVTVRITPKGAAKLAVLMGVLPETVAELLAAMDESDAA